MGQHEHTSTLGGRYRGSKYFLQDQLRCSEAVSDFRSVKELIGQAQGFSTRRAFRFQSQTVPVRADQ